MSAEKIPVKTAADELKLTYSINKNISNNLNKAQQKELLSLLENNSSVLALVEAFVSKNKELSNNNRKYGRQREEANQEKEKAKQNLADEQKRNNDLSTDVSQLKYELKELKNQLVNTLDSFHHMLVNDILTKSEIISFVANLRDSFKNN